MSDVLARAMPHHQDLRGWSGRLLVAASSLVLITAAFLKLLSPGNPLQIGPWHIAGPWPYLLPPLELALALGLIAGYRPRWMWMAGRVLFGIFTVLHLWAFANPSHDCGCFGAVSIPPVAVLGVVAVLCASFLIVRIPDHGQTLPWRWSIAAVTVLGLVAGSVGIVQRMSAASQPGSANVLTELQGLESIGMASSPASQVPTGDWLVCYYRGSCAHCRESLPGWNDLAQDLHERFPRLRWLFVNMDGPDGAPDPFISTGLPYVLHRRVPDRYREAPSFVRIVDRTIRAYGPEPLALLGNDALTASVAVGGIAAPLPALKPSLPH